MAQTTTAYNGIANVVQGNDAFVWRVAVASVNAAIDVAAEPSSTANYARRQALVPRVLQAPGLLSQQFAYAIAIQQNLTTVASTTDAMLYAGALAVWNAMAGIEVV
jgi:hypothetical protein